MSEPEILPPDEADIPRPATDASFSRGAPPQKRDPLPLLFGAGVVVLVAAVIFLWFHPLSPGGQHNATEARLDQLQQQVDALSKQLNDVAQRPVPQPPDLHPLDQRLTALEARPSVDPAQLGDLRQRIDGVSQQLQGVTAAQAPIDGRLDTLGKQQDALSGRLDALARQQQVVATLSGRVDALARQQQTQGPALVARLDALDKRVGDLSDRQTSAASALGSRVDALTARLDQQVTAQQGATTALSGRLDQQEKQVGTIATQAGQISGVADRAARLQRIQAANAALQAGRPLGELPGAPDALTKFRDQPPPTEASLRLAFPQVAVAAERASRPDTSQMPFWQAAQTRAEALLTVRRGDHVLVGDPAAGVVARARHALDAGDLPGAVSALEELQGPAAQAVASWLDQAHALLAARAALASLAAHA